MAVGVACAGTGMRAATDLLEPLLGDAVDFVRQGALIASALVLMQQPEAKVRSPGLCRRRSLAPAAWVHQLPADGRMHAPAPPDACSSLRRVFALSAARLIFISICPQRLRPSLPSGAARAQVSAFRRRVERVVGDKHEEAMARMGAIMAAGLLDAGGRNATPALRAHSGYFRRTSVVALALFTQYWCGWG
jgi:26S proteasome regulatory subunit N2